jgi:hypothetical protein
MGQPIGRRRVLAVVLGALLVAALAYGALAQAGPTTRAACGTYGGGCYGGGGGYGGGTYGSKPGNNPGSTNTTTTTTNQPAPVVPAATLEQLKLLFKIKGNLSLAALLNKGLVINIVCNEPCTIDGSLLIARNVAGRLHTVRSRQVKIASGHAKSKKGGKVKLRIKAKARAARGLRHTSRVKGILRITAKGKGGQKKHITKKVTLKK